MICWTQLCILETFWANLHLGTSWDQSRTFSSATRSFQGGWSFHSCTGHWGLTNGTSWTTRRLCIQKRTLPRYHDLLWQMARHDGNWENRQPYLGKEIYTSDWIRADFFAHHTRQWLYFWTASALARTNLDVFCLWKCQDPPVASHEGGTSL